MSKIPLSSRSAFSLSAFSGGYGGAAPMMEDAAPTVSDGAQTVYMLQSKFLG